MQLQEQQLRRTFSLAERARNYYELTKPKIVYLLVFTALSSTFIATRILHSQLSVFQWMLAGIAITAGCAGCNVLTCYLDRDIDAVMLRTRRRPIPSGRITARDGLIFGLVLTGLSLVLSLVFNVLSFAWMALGVFDNVIVYSLLLKRRTSLNILLGGFSGGLPVMFGWSVVTPGPIGSFTSLPVIMAGLVFLWIPVHIWFLAVTFRADYESVGVPMLPVIVGKDQALRIIMIASIILFPFSLAVWLVGHFSIIYGIVALTMGVANLVGSGLALYRPTERNAWRMFKLSSPYLFLLFLGMIIDAAVH
ncbi:MAG TPA: heme o synthase [Candidatus Binatus sp.]|nr:heme o synthase [Candidatus Binatus sp.]